MMMMMIMIASFVDSITTPIKSWLDNGDDHHTAANMTVKAVGVGCSRVDCIVCLSEVALGDRLAVLGRCKHGFHVDCVEAWLKDHPNCPLCRAPVFGADGIHQHQVYLKKSYEILRRYGFRVVEIVGDWLTGFFSRGLESSLTQSCSYLVMSRQHN